MRKGNNQDFRRYVKGAKKLKISAKHPVMNRSIMEYAIAGMTEKLSELAHITRESFYDMAKIMPAVSAQLADEARELRERLEENGADQQDADE